ncbi:MAG: preprotein translocase subunit SecA [Patescibacteria group bacterium]|jgi:preprotein translocase subunit SecA
MSIFSSLFGDPNERAVQKLEPYVEQINAREKEIAKRSEEEIKKRIAEMRVAIQKEEATLDDHLVEVFAMVRETARRVLNMRHFDVQLMGGVVLHQGKIAEMKTGEGKTLVATLALALNALSKKGVHLVTVNDYLAKRDVQWMGQVYDALGLTVSCLQHEQAYQFDAGVSEEGPMQHLKPVTRQAAYQADIVYGTNSEFGFDYLRDNMAPEMALRVQQDLNFAIIDEVDSILIDEARTPLIISAPAQQATDLYRKYAQLVTRLEEGPDFNIDEKMRAASLTEQGIAKMEKALGVENIYVAGGIEMVHHLEQALRAEVLYKKDREYVVKNGEVIIVDEFTGRMMEGRRFSEGLHQAIEAKEQLDIKQESQTLATISIQNLFRMYPKLAGMTGTAATEAEEFFKIYGLDVSIIPSNKPLQRDDRTDRIYKSERGKYIAVAKEIRKRHELGQPVLVGTVSIKKNEVLSQLLTEEGIPHEVLNAKNHEREAHIIEQAGKKGGVTVATNMAGRGVDIILGGVPLNKEAQKEVVELGGLHVIGTERHESRRIDNQLRGRAGRQGDPGSSQFYLSLEDDLMRIFANERMKSMMNRLGMPEDMPIENRFITRSIEQAQKKVEGNNFDIRKHLVEYDDVMNKHREAIYRLRRELLEQKGEALHDRIQAILEQEIESVISFHTSSENPQEWNIEEVYEVVDTIFPVSLQERLMMDDVLGEERKKASLVERRTKLTEYLIKLAEDRYAELTASFENPERLEQILRGVLLRTLDTLWIEHLEQMDYLRQGIGLRGYGQKDPLIEYKREAHTLYTQFLNSFQSQTATSVYKVVIAQHVEHSPLAGRQTIELGAAKSSSDLTSPQQIMGSASTVSTSAPQAAQSVTAEKIGRNDLCPCGSGKKYKKCGLINSEEHQQLSAAKR